MSTFPQGFKSNDINHVLSYIMIICQVRKVDKCQKCPHFHKKIKIINSDFLRQPAWWPLERQPPPHLDQLLSNSLNEMHKLILWVIVLWYIMVTYHDINFCFSVWTNSLVEINVSGIIILLAGIPFRPLLWSGPSSFIKEAYMPIYMINCFSLVRRGDVHHIILRETWSYYVINNFIYIWNFWKLDWLIECFFASFSSIKYWLTWSRYQ